MKTPGRFSMGWASFVVRRPELILITLLVLGVLGTWMATKLTINSNQLDLISQDLQEVKDVKRIIDMVGGAGYLMVGLRSEDEKQLKAVSDDLAEMLVADKENVRFITYKVPVEFIQTNMVLFVKNEDLVEGKKRINAYMKDQLRRSNPFFIEIKKTEPVKLDLTDLIDKYSHVGKKSIRDDYYISDDRKMIIVLIKPMWDGTKLAQTKTFVDKLNTELADYSRTNHRGANGTPVELVEDYAHTPPRSGKITYGFTGSYKSNLDDSYAMQESLGPVSIVAFLGIVIITVIFFRRLRASLWLIIGTGVGLTAGLLETRASGKVDLVRSLYFAIAVGFAFDYLVQIVRGIGTRWKTSPGAGAIARGVGAATVGFFVQLAPSLIVIIGMVIGTLITMGFTYITVHELNMVTSILGGILMGFGVDYGIHFTFRTRIELGAGKPYDIAIRDALINAGRPALVAAVVTGGSFLVLMVSEFRGFSQFGFLAGCGTVIIGVTLFSWSPAVLALLGKFNPALPARLIGTMTPPKSMNEGGEIRIPRPKLVLAIASVFVALCCAFAIPWKTFDAPKGRSATAWERLTGGVRFNYNTRALQPEAYHSVQLQDEVNERFQISSDPTAVYTRNLEETKEVWDEITLHPEKYSTISQAVSVFSFVPEPVNAAKNAKVLAEWQEELKDIDVSALPPEMQDKAEQFKKILAVRPFDVSGVPAVYSNNFLNLPTAKPENHGYLTFLYPGVDLWDGKKMIEFNDQTVVIKTAQGHEYRSAGLPILYAKLARIVLWDGKLTVILVALWILMMHFADFRSAPLALASVIPLGVGLVMMLGFMSMLDLRLNFMNIIVLPILLGFGVSHGLYLLHRFLEGTSPVVALRSVGAAVASSTLTAIAGFGSLFVAQHNGLKSMGMVACLGLATTLLVSFTVLAAVLQLLHDRRSQNQKSTDDDSHRSAA